MKGLQFNVSHAKYRHIEIEILDDVDEIGTVFDNETLSYPMLIEQQKNGRSTGRFGFEGLDREYEVNGEEQLITGPVKHRSFSFFTLQEVSFDRVKFQFGGRVENNRYDPADPNLRDRSITGISHWCGF